jgi:hypothetical protein
MEFIPSNIWVTCPNPKCGFPFYVGPEYMDPSRGHPAKKEVLDEMYCKCPKCKGNFKLDQSATKPGIMPWLPKTSQENP